MLTIVDFHQHKDDIATFDYLLSDGSVHTLTGYCGPGFYYDLADKLEDLGVHTCACKISYRNYHTVQNDSDRCRLAE